MQAVQEENELVHEEPDSPLEKVSFALGRDSPDPDDDDDDHSCRSTSRLSDKLTATDSTGELNGKCFTIGQESDDSLSAMSSDKTMASSSSDSYSCVENGHINMSAEELKESADKLHPSSTPIAKSKFTINHR